MFDQYLKAVVNGKELNADEAYASAKLLLQGEVNAARAASFLTAMRFRKESSDELNGFVQALLEEAVRFDSDMELIDTCGTGGDGLGTFNISTAAALVIAGCGIPVAKHGNKAVTGKVGSADVLEGLGVNIRMKPDEARALLGKAGITFLFAPLYHPILAKVGALRRDMGVPTIFNFLGPILNPFPLTYQVMGVADASLQEAVAETLVNLGRKRALVVHAENGMDEISPGCKTRVYDMENDRLKIYDMAPEEYGISPVSLDEIQGGSLEVSTRIVSEVLAGQQGPYRDTVLLNAAAAVVAAGRADTISEGLQAAAESIDSGRAREALQRMIRFSRDGALAC